MGRAGACADGDDVPGKQVQVDARTPFQYKLGVIPVGRQSSAFGYSQALDGTWEEYLEDQRRRRARRDNIRDAADFMGWYMTVEPEPGHPDDGCAAASTWPITRAAPGIARQLQRQVVAAARVRRVGNAPEIYQRSCNAAGKSVAALTPHG